MIYDSAKCAIVILVFCGLSVPIAGENSFARLQLSNGGILGRKLQTKQNTTAYVYLGIPYGEVPIGNLRYRAPVPKKSWSGLLNTQQYKAACLQNSSGNGSLYVPGKMSEDCLLMNVFTSENCLRTSKRCPVIYYIHGGGWQYDSPTMFEADFLADNFAANDVVMITVTYRLGSFGFFSTGKKTSADKNVGLLDVIEGLHWVQREVGAFGGDKNRITIMGHSSGGTAVDLLSILPSVGGLFNQIVIMSGSKSSQPKNDTNVPGSKAFAIRAGCASESSWGASDQFEAILACLRGKNGSELLLIQRELEDEDISFNGPAVEDGNGFVLDLEVLRRNRKPYPCLTGDLSSEFREMLMIGPLQNSTLNQQLLLKMCENVAKNRGFRHVNEVGLACANHYSRRQEDFLMDDMIHLAVYETGEELRSKGAPVFKYSFEYEGIAGALFMENPMKLFHSYDMVYVMGLHMGKLTQKDEKIREIYSSAFVNFAKSGDPSMTNAAKWQPTDDRNNYFKINFDDNLKMPGNLNGYHGDAVKFWTITAKNLDDYLTENSNAEILLGYNKIIASSPSSHYDMWSYVPVFAIVICLAFIIALLYKRKRDRKNLDPEAAKLNANIMKSYS